MEESFKTVSISGEACIIEVHHGSEVPRLIAIQNPNCRSTSAENFDHPVQLYRSHRQLSNQLK